MDQLNSFMINNSSGVQIGTVESHQFSGSVDAAYVRITSGTAPTNNLINSAGTNQLSTSTLLPGSGTVINKIGQKTGHTTGKILSTNASIAYAYTPVPGTPGYANTTFTNLTTADYSSAKGDSGGVVYAYYSGPNIRYTLGIHVANQSNTAYYVKADLIHAALGISRY
jgi:streptogrisin B